MSAPIDAARLREAIARCRGHKLTEDDRNALIAVAETHIRTLPDPVEDTVLVIFPPDGSDPHLTKGLNGQVLANHREAEAKAADWSRRWPDWRFVVVRRPA